MTTATQPEPNVSPAGGGARVRPIREPQRFGFLDFLRGVALLGILPENLPYFAHPLILVEAPLEPGGGTWHDILVVHLIRFFGDYKFISLFSLMFGVGLALIHSNCVRSGRPFGWLYTRRIGLLFGFGALHVVLLWYGDILIVYALLGFLAMWMVNRSPRTLRRAGAVLICVPVVAMLVFVPFASTGNAAEDDFDFITSQPTTDSRPASNPIVAILVRYLHPDNETRIYRDGPVDEIVKVRLVSWVLAAGYIIPYIGWRSLGLFLIGMAFLKEGWFTRPAENMRRFARMMRVGLLVGVPLQAVASLYPLLATMDERGKVISELCKYCGSLGLAAIYLWLIARVFVACEGRAWTRPIIAVGRMALSNYILMSVLCGVIFYSHGLRQFAQLNRAQVLALNPVIWSICLLFSIFWMSRFEFGPLEWIWRKLTYPGRLAMRGPIPRRP